jgi:hypothetical protein
MEGRVCVSLPTAVKQCRPGGGDAGLRQAAGHIIHPPQERAVAVTLAQTSIAGADAEQRSFGIQRRSATGRRGLWSADVPHRSETACNSSG